MTSTLHHPATRVTLSDEVPGIYKAMLRLDQAVADTPLERPLKELVRIRASQINGCAYCIDMHTLDARSIGGVRAADVRSVRLAGGAVLHRQGARGPGADGGDDAGARRARSRSGLCRRRGRVDRKSTRLNSSHL